MDDDGGGGVGQLQRFVQRRAGGECAGEVRHHRIACAHDVNLAAYGLGGNMCAGAIGCRADDAAFSERDKNGPAISLRELRGGLPDFIWRRDDIRLRKLGQLGGVHLEND